MGSVTDGCHVCGRDSAYVNNKIVYCDGAECNLGVHQVCYGINKIPKGCWYCEKCIIIAKEAKITCELCPNKLGAFKPTNTNKMAHVVCALYIPEVYFGDTKSMTPVMLDSLPRSRYHSVCYICTKKGRSVFESEYGVSVKCNVQNCTQYFHATCGQAEGLLCEIPSSTKGKINYCGYCKKHCREENEATKFAPAFSPIKSIPPVITKRTTPRKSEPKSKRKSSLKISFPDQETIASLPLANEPFEINDLLDEIELTKSKTSKARSKSVTPNRRTSAESTRRTIASCRRLRRSTNQAIFQSRRRSSDDELDTVNDILSLSNSIEDAEEITIVKKYSKRGRKPTRGKSRKLSSFLDESGCVSLPSVTSFRNNETLSPKPEVIPEQASPEQGSNPVQASTEQANPEQASPEQANPEQTDLNTNSDCPMEIEFSDKEQIQYNQVDENNDSASAADDSSKCTTNSMTQDADDLNKVDSDQENEDDVAPADECSPMENEDYNNENENSDMGTAEMPVLETENASNQSPSSNDSASESDSSDSNSESDSSDSETTEQPAKVKSIFDISSSEEDNETIENKRLFSTPLEANLSFNLEQITIGESSVENGKQEVESQENMIEEVNESTNEVEKSSSLGKASTDGTSLAVDESSEGSMVDVTPMETKSDSESSNDDAEVDEDSANEQNLSAGTDPELQCSPKILNPDNMNTSGSSSSQSAHSNVEDISVIPAIVNTSTSIDSNREISSYDAQESFDEDMDSDPINDDAGNDLCVQEYVIMTTEETTSNTSNSIVVTVPPDEAIITDNNAYDIISHNEIVNTSNIDTDIEMANKCDIFLSPLHQVSKARAESRQEINCNLQCDNLRGSDNQTFNNLRDLMDDLTISHKASNHLRIPNAADVNSFNKITLEETVVPVNVLDARSPCSQSQNGSSKNCFDNNLASSYMECSEPKVMGNKAWTHLKLHPIPKDIPKQDKKLLSNYGEFVKVSSYLLYLQKLKADNDIIEKRVQELQQKKANLLQTLPMERDFTSVFPTPPPSERNIALDNIGVAGIQPTNQVPNFWKESDDEVLLENVLLNQEPQQPVQNDLVYSLFYDFTETPSPAPIPSSIRQEYDEFMQLQSKESDEKYTSCPKKKKRVFKKISKKRKLI
ncbi:uncharacterized protein isoform X2 [Rhodnius prolixus]|uniref:uncharacterized protein isoform X2 n=1 Tax=Rhodnius prolixus TaxID=13249 RepID=UPI003D187BA1